MIITLLGPNIWITICEELIYNYEIYQEPISYKIESNAPENHESKMSLSIENHTRPSNSYKHQDRIPYQQQNTGIADFDIGSLHNDNLETDSCKSWDTYSLIKMS